MNLGSEVVKTIGARVFLAVFGFVGTIVFARVLGPTAFGGYYLLLTVVQLADRPFRGWTVGVEKRYSENKSDKTSILGTALLFNFLGIIVFAPFAYVFRDRLSEFTGIPDAASLFLLLLGALVYFYPIEQLISAEGRVALATYIDGFRSVLTLGLQLLFVGIGLGVAGMAYGLAGATIVAVGVNLYILGRLPSLPDADSVRSVADFARYAIPTSIVGKTYSRLDTLLIGFVLTPAVVGEYEVALKLTLPAIFVSNSIRKAMFPKVSNLHSRGEEIVEDIRNSKAFTSILAVPLFFGSLALSQRVIVTVYGAQYRGAGLLLIGLALYRILDTQSQIHVRTLEAVDRPQSVFRASAVALAINILIGYALALVYGAKGVIFATIIAEAIRYTFIVSSTKDIVDIDYFSGELLLQIIAGSIMFLSVLGAKQLVIHWSWLTLLSIVGFGAAVYFGILAAISSKIRVTVTGIISDFRSSSSS